MKLQKSNFLAISTASLLLSALVSGNVFAAEEDYATRQEFNELKEGIKAIFDQNSDKIVSSAESLENKVAEAINTTSDLKNKVEEITSSTGNIEGQLAHKADIDAVNYLVAAAGQRTDGVLIAHADELIRQDSSIKQLEHKQDELIAKANSDIEVNNYVKEKLQEHDENLANKADKAEVGKSFNELHEYNKNVDKTLNEYYKVLNAHDEFLSNHADRLEDIIANKADVADVVNTAKQVNHNTARIQNVEDKTTQLHQKLRHGLAAQAALTGLFQPYNVGKANISAAVGGYRSTTAVAVGTGYRFNEHVATKAGVAFSTGGNRAVSYHAGVNYEW